MQPAPRDARTGPAVTIHFNGRTLAAEADAPTRLAALQRQLATNQTAVVLLGLAQPATAGLRVTLRRAGITLLAYVADQGWIARVASGPQPPLRAVTVCRPLDAGLRVSTRFQQADRARPVPLYVHLLPDCHPEQLQAALRAAAMEGPGLCPRSQGALLAGCVAGAALDRFLNTVGEHPDVLFVEPGGGAHLLNNYGIRTLQSGSFTGTTPLWDQRLYGSNQVIAILDTGIDPDSDYFRDPGGQWPPTNRLGGTTVDRGLRKVIAADFLWAADNPANLQHWGSHYHGTRVAGHALGSRLDDPFGKSIYNGMAPAAKLVVQDAGYAIDDYADLPGLGTPVTNFYPALIQAVAQGATIHNNSWGDRENFHPHNTYTQPCRELDLVTWTHREFLVVCAAGNDGYQDVSSPSVAKNALSVAATGTGPNQDTIASFSSRGWASDGRYKPDLAAPGAGVTSANSNLAATNNTDIATGSGTSYSSPMAAGMAALVRDYFAQGFHPTGAPTTAHARPHPSAALVKAVLINSAMPMTGAASPPPARDQGWGRINLARTLVFTNSSHALLVSDEETGFADPIQAVPSWYLDVTSATQPLRVTLVWTDYPATAGATKHLVNDLDLVVRAPGQLYRGNALAGGWSTPGGAADRTNNVEQVLWQTPATGLVEISVASWVVPQPTQTFALVVTGAFRNWDTATDQDGDGLADAGELHHFGDLTHDGTADSDGDGAKDRAEFAAGTDPTDAASVLRLHGLTTENGERVLLRWSSTPARLYAVDTCTTPATDAWSMVTGALPATPPYNTATVRLDAVRARFYRVRVEMNPDGAVEPLMHANRR